MNDQKVDLEKSRRVYILNEGDGDLFLPASSCSCQLNRFLFSASHKMWMRRLEDPPLPPVGYDYIGLTLEPRDAIIYEDGRKEGFGIVIFNPGFLLLRGL